MGSGNNTPISLHSVHPLLFATVWSLIGETMVAQGFLDRSVCEQIAKQVSITNRCPICITAHAMMQAAAVNAAAEAREARKREAPGALSMTEMDDESSSRATLQAEAIEYAKLVHKATQAAALKITKDDS